MITFAKGITWGSVPMGGVIVRKGIYDAFMRGPMHVAELFHGYTYSAHPLACAAGLATLELYREEGLFERAHKLEPVWAEAAMSQGPAQCTRHPLRRAHRRHRPRLAPGRGRQARLRGHGQSLPRARSGGARRRRDPRAHSAADRERARNR